VKKKKSKTRSRQKNLRRDTRPRDKLPPHLTAETLRKRLKKTDDDSAAAEIPWYVDRAADSSVLS
jgi:hypothetical protein